MHKNYSRSQVERLLRAWRELRDGYYPADTNALPGYRGRAVAEKAPWTLAAEALADLEAAIQRLAAHLRVAVRQRFWLGRRTHQPAWRLVDAVYEAI